MNETPLPFQESLIQKILIALRHKIEGVTLPHEVQEIWGEVASLLFEEGIEVSVEDIERVYKYVCATSLTHKKLVLILSTHFKGQKKPDLETVKDLLHSFAPWLTEKELKAASLELLKEG